MSRKRGAQPGNRNSVKHGFYSKQFDLEEKMSLGLIAEADLSNEIELFRVQIRRFAQAENESREKLDLLARREVMHTMSLAIECFNRLVRTHAILNSPHVRSKGSLPESPLLDEPVA